MIHVTSLSPKMQNYYEKVEKEVLQDRSVPIGQFDQVEHTTAKRIQKRRLRAVSDVFALPVHQTDEIQSFIDNEVEAKVTAQRFRNHDHQKEKRAREELYLELETRIDAALKQELKSHCAGIKEITFTGSYNGNSSNSIFGIRPRQSMVTYRKWRDLYKRALRDIFESRGFHDINIQLASRRFVN